MARAKSFFPGGLKFNLASVKYNHNYEKKYFECVFGCRVRNITGRATTPDTTVPCFLQNERYSLVTMYWQLISEFLVLKTCVLHRFKVNLPLDLCDTHLQKSIYSEITCNI